MKTWLFLSVFIVSTAHAGTSSKEPMVEPPAAEPCLMTWFAAGSVGYLTELEEPMYHLMFGVDPCWNFAGGRITLFAEIGYASRDESYNAGNVLIPLPGTIPPKSSFDLDDLEGALKDSAATGLLDTDYELRIVPITFNIQYERPIYRNLKGYIGAGLGAAWVDLDADAGSFGTFRADDWVFTAQLFGGAIYQLNRNVDLFAGARWIYYQDADLGGGTFKMDDDFLLEIGARFRF